MDILIGTKNRYKATEMVSFLGKPSGVSVHFLDKTNLNVKIKEDKKLLRKMPKRKQSHCLN